MKKSELKQIIKEEISKILNEDKYQIVFIDYYNNEIPYTERYFTSEREAENWVNDQKSYSDDYFEVDYYNPETQEKYLGYRTIKIK
jgi:hypothetical protein